MHLVVLSRGVVTKLTKHMEASVLVTLSLLLPTVLASAQTVSLSPTSLSFGNEAVGTTSIAKLVTLTNTGTATLTISSVQTTGNFAQTNTCGSTLSAHSKCTISVTFTPTATGVITGSVIVGDNASNSPQTVSTKGTGLLAVALSPTKPTFASQTVGTTSSPLSVTLTNNLTTAATVSGLSVTGDFGQTNTCGTSVGGGQKCTISVTFTPTVVGTRTGTLTVSDTASNSPQTASLSGTGSVTGLVSIAVTPANPALQIGSTQQFQATGTFNTGSTHDLTQSVTWSSTSPTKATVSNTAGTKGVASGLATGTTTIKATVGSITGSTVLTVNPRLVSISVTPAASSIALGTKQQYTATGTYSNGSTQNLTGSVNWSSSSTNIATLDNGVGTQGMATARATGTTSITAASGNVSGSTTLTVTPAALTTIIVTPALPSISPGTTQPFTATGMFTDGSTQDVTGTVQWSSSVPSVATISNSAGTQGLASSIAVGTTTISAISGTVSGSTALTVTPAALVSIAVNPPNPILVAGNTQPFTATGTFTDNSTQDLTNSVTWSSASTGVASISETGLATGIVAGTTTISATSGSTNGSTTLTVTAATLGQQWQSFSSPTEGPITSQVLAADGSLIIAASGTGVYRTVDGSNFTLQAGVGLGNAVIESLLTIGTQLYAGTHDGVYVSSDSGATWVPMSTGMMRQTSGIPVTSKYPTVFALANYNGTPIAGTDAGFYSWGGSSWIRTTIGQEIRSMVATSNAIYLGSSCGCNGGGVGGDVWKSVDGGNSFSRFNLPVWSVRAMAVDASGTVYAGAWNKTYAQGGVYRSTDGVSWTGPLLPSVSVNAILSVNGTVYLGTRNAVLYTSTDGGVTYQTSTAPMKAVLSLLSTPIGMFAGSDGIYLDNGTGFSRAQRLGNKQQITQVVQAANGDIYERSTYFGIYRSTDGGITFNELNNGIPNIEDQGPLGNELFLNALGEVLAEKIDGIYRLTNDGTTFVQSNLDATQYTVGHLLLPDGSILVGDWNGNIYKSSDNGSTFAKLSRVAAGGKNAGLTSSINRDSTGTLYVSGEGPVFSSTDNGLTWVNMNIPATGNANYILPTLNSSILVSKPCSSAGCIFRYENGSWVRSDSGILAGDEVNFLYNGVTPGYVYASSRYAIYRSADDGHTWTVLIGLPQTDDTYYGHVNPMQMFRDSNNYLFVGMWQTGLGAFKSVSPQP